jgi:hypothetical protein
VVPFIMLAVALFLLFNLLDVPRSLLTIAAGHSVIALPYAALILLSRLIGLDPALEDAAMDLRRELPTTLRRIVLPAGSLAPLGVADLLHRLVRRGRAGGLPGGPRPDLPGLPLRSAALRADAAGDDRDGRAPDGRHGGAYPGRLRDPLPQRVSASRPELAGAASGMRAVTASAAGSTPGRSRPACSKACSLAAMASGSRSPCGRTGGRRRGSRHRARARRGRGES